MRKERVGLEHRVHVALVRREPGNALAADPHLAFVGPLEARDQPESRRLAAARGTEERQELARVDFEVDRVDRDDVTEALRDPYELDIRGSLAAGRWAQKLGALLIHVTSETCCAQSREPRAATLVPASATCKIARRWVVQRAQVPERAAELGLGERHHRDLAGIRVLDRLRGRASAHHQVAHRLVGLVSSADARPRGLQRSGRRRLRPTCAPRKARVASDGRGVPRAAPRRRGGSGRSRSFLPARSRRRSRRSGLHAGVGWTCRQPTPRRSYSHSSLQIFGVSPTLGLLGTS